MTDIQLFFTLKESLSIQYEYYKKKNSMLIIDLHEEDNPAEIVDCLKELGIKEFAIPRFYIKKKSSILKDLVYYMKLPDLSIYTWSHPGCDIEETKAKHEESKKENVYPNVKASEETIRRFVEAGCTRQNSIKTEVFGYGVIDAVTFTIG